MIAGPNGSGKSSLLKYLRTDFCLNFGRYLNADDVERTIAESGEVHFAEFGLTIADNEFQSFLSTHPLSSRLSTADAQVTIRSNVLSADLRRGGSYFSAILCDFIRRRWLETRESFSFETVMSGKDKCQLLQAAKNIGYRTYLYYVCTDATQINCERVAFRVAQGGHDVPKALIESRYHRSLAFLPHAIQLSSRAYLFDNSARSLRFIAEFEEGKLSSVSESPPEWFKNSWNGNASDSS